MAKKIKNHFIFYVFLVFSWISSMYIVGFGKQTQFAYWNQDIFKPEIIRPVQSRHLINQISRGGELGKSGPGPRAKADARKTGGGNLFVQGFTPQRQYCSHRINKSLSCRNNANIQKNQFNSKQNNQNGTLTKQQKRNLPHPEDVIIPEQNVIIRHNQAKHKVKKHGSDFSIPSKKNGKGRLLTPRTPENIESFKEKIKNLVLRGERIEGTYRGQAVTHFYDSETRDNTIFIENEFLSAWKLAERQETDLLTNQNVGDY